MNLSSILDESETKRIDGAKFVNIFLLSKYTAQNIKIFVKISQKLSRWKFCAIFVDNTGHPHVYVVIVDR